MEKGLTIGELARRTKVSRQTIHFYIKKGLLPRPVKTSKTWAYYSTEHIERLEKIKILKSQYFFPLKVIKGILEEGFQRVEPGEKSHFVPTADIKKINSGITGTGKTFTREELSIRAGISTAFIEELEQMGFILPYAGLNGKKRYDYDDITLVKSFYSLIVSGTGRLEDLRFYQYFIHVLSDEMNFVNEKIIKPGRLKVIRLKQIKSYLRSIKKYFEKRIYRYEEKQIARKYFKKKF